MASAHIGLAGCYEPALRDCTLRCSKPHECVEGQVCLDGLCAGPSVLRCTEAGEPVIIDASAVTGDAPPPPSPDAFDVCSQGCSNGTCIAGVCTIDCSAFDSCPNDVVCPANLPCHVICGDSACANKINCTMATSCEVDCIGEDACLDEVQCPSSRPCDVTCSGTSSCRRTKCSNACSCDVTCSGPGSCREASECPESYCRVGNGCSSQLTGCDTCP